MTRATTRISSPDPALEANKPTVLAFDDTGITRKDFDIPHQTLDETFRIHATRLVRGGDRDTLRDALVFMAQFGATRAWNARSVLGTLRDGLA
jgi:hypothetical protein